MTECSAFVDEQFKHYNNIMQILTCPGAGFNQFIADRLYETSWNYWASSDSKGIFDECRLTFLQDISSKVTEYNIPPELVINAEQTPSSYVSVGKQTMAKKGLPLFLKGLMDKRNITLTFSITLSGTFLPMQIIYSGKTKTSQTHNFVFPKGFCVTQNPKHWSNEEEILNLIKTLRLDGGLSTALLGLLKFCGNILLLDLVGPLKSF